MVCKIKMLLILVFASYLILGISGSSRENATVMKVGILIDIDNVYRGPSCFELKENRMLYVSDGGTWPNDKGIYNSEMDGNIGFDAIEVNEK